MKCSQGCNEKAIHFHPDWPEDDEQKLCSDCRVSSLEDLIDRLEEEIDEYQLEIRKLKKRRK